MNSGGSGATHCSRWMQSAAAWHSNHCSQPAKLTRHASPQPPHASPHAPPQAMDSWHLAAAEQLAASCKSVLLGLAATAGQVPIEQVLAVARAEEDHQIEHWGLVEGGHDIDIADLRVRVAAPSLFVRLLKRH